MKLNGLSGPLALFFALLSISFSGCAHRPDAVTSDQRPPEEVRAEVERGLEMMRAETMRALELEQQADLVIDYERPDRIWLRTPGQTTQNSATDTTLAAAIASATSKRALAVVIIGKPVQFAFPEPQLREKVDAIEGVVRAQGFTRVVFQLGRGMGRPTYRE